MHWKLFWHLMHNVWYVHCKYLQPVNSHWLTCVTVIWQWMLQATTVHMIFNNTEEHSLRSIAILDCSICSKITVVHVTLPKAVLSKYSQNICSVPITYGVHLVCITLQPTSVTMQFRRLLSRRHYRRAGRWSMLNSKAKLCYYLQSTNTIYYT